MLILKMDVRRLDYFNALFSAGTPLEITFIVMHYITCLFCLINLVKPIGHNPFPFQSRSQEERSFQGSFLNMATVNTDKKSDSAQIILRGFSVRVMMNN